MAKIIVILKGADAQKTSKFIDWLKPYVGHNCDYSCLDWDRPFDSNSRDAVNEALIVLFVYSKEHKSDTDRNIEILNYALDMHRSMFLLNIDNSPLTDLYSDRITKEQQINIKSEDEKAKFICDINRILEDNNPLKEYNLKSATLCVAYVYNEKLSI